MYVKKTMSEREIEVSVLGMKFRYKRVKSPSILRPCKHYISEHGVVRKKLLTFHGGADGSESGEQHEI